MHFRYWYTFIFISDRFFNNSKLQKSFQYTAIVINVEISLYTKLESVIYLFQNGF